MASYSLLVAVLFVALAAKGAQTSSVGVDTVSAVAQTHPSPEEILRTFWDEVDFTDAIDSVAVEQKFADFAYVLPYVKQDEWVRMAVAAFVRHASCSPQGVRLAVEMADKYLFSPDSPMFNETLYILLAETILAEATPGEAQRERLKHNLGMASLNRPGTPFPDFEVEDPDGTKWSMGAMACGSPVTVVMFYDPDCDGCNNAIGKLSSDCRFVQSVAEGRVQVVAVYVGDFVARWRRHAASLPAEWRVVRALTGIEDDEIVVLRTMPAIYVVDPDGVIRAKEASCQAVLAL